MGLTSSRQLISPEQDNFSSRFTYIRNKGDINFYIENISGKEYATKIIVCDTVQEQTQFFMTIQKTTQLNNDNIIGVEKVYCLENKSCGTVASKYLILFPYAFRNIKDQRDQRVVLQQNFSEPELWSILLSVCRTLSFLHDKSIPFTPLNCEQILINKEGILQLDVHRLANSFLLQDNYFSRNTNLRYVAPEIKNSKMSYTNLRETEKQNIYSLGIILLELLEMRDLAQLQYERNSNEGKDVVKLLINRSTYFSGELRQIIRRLTQINKENRPSYKEIIQFIQNEEEAQNVLYEQKQIPTAKKNQYIAQNPLNFNDFEDKPSLSMKMQIPNLLTNGYAIPSFSYNNIREGIQKSKVTENNMKQTQIPQFINNHTIKEGQKLSYHSDMAENSTGLFNPVSSGMYPSQYYHQGQEVAHFPHPSFVTGSMVSQPNKHQLISINNFSPMRRVTQFNQGESNDLNFPKDSLPSQFDNSNMRPKFQSPLLNRNIESHVTQIDSNLNLMKPMGVADNIKLIFPKPSFFSRDSNQTTLKNQSKNNFSKTGSIQGFNKIYNDYPQYYYQNIDYKDLNNIGRLWLYFQGHFKDGKRFGPGTLYMSNGEKFQGNFINDFAQGRGKYSTLDWKSIEGIWRNGHLISII